MWKLLPSVNYWRVRAINYLIINFQAVSQRLSLWSPQEQFSLGVGLSVPLYDGGSNASDVMVKTQRLTLVEKEKVQLEEQHNIKFENFITIESAIVASILESREKINKLDREIRELIERQKMGQSNFEELTTKQIQKIDLEIISEELWTKLVGVWASHWENLVAE